MTIVLVACKKDLASMNIADHVLDLLNPRRISEFLGNPVYNLFEDVLMVFIEKEHIFYDRLDSDLSRVLGIRPKIIMFLSRHSSATGIRTLTVHPIGNFRENTYGGLPKTLVPAEPYLMSETLRCLYEASKDLDYKCSYEVTHHGPYLSSRAFFVEIGSNEASWRDPDAGSAVASAVVNSLERYLNKEHSRKKPIVGVGGGHYAPRFSSYALEGYNFGHMVPEHYMSLESVLMALQMTPEASSVGFHWKGSNEKYLELYRALEEKGIKVEKLK